MAERVAQILTIVTFVTLCWVLHRSFDERVQCVHSPFIAAVQIEDQSINNCDFESRLSFIGWSQRLTIEQAANLRALEVLEPLKLIFPALSPTVMVHVSGHQPDQFELGSSYIRLGAAWLSDRMQVRRALVMSVLQSHFPVTYQNRFHLETITDFLLLAAFGEDRWRGEGDRVFSMERDLRFATVASTPETYCLSPFRSLAHAQACKTDAQILGSAPWSLRPLMAVSLWRAFNRLSLTQRLEFIANLQSGKELPEFADLKDNSIEQMVFWMQRNLSAYMHALVDQTADVDNAIRLVLQELQVEAPTRWELTIDLTNTPAWQDIYSQLQRRSEVVLGERVLVFTPEGAVALPSGLPVAWSQKQVHSQKHVMIACTWPKPEDTLQVSARKIYAQQNCGKLQQPFWD